MVRSRRDVASQHPSGDLPAKVDPAQMETGEGPCLTAAYENQPVRVTDMAQEERWPRFAPPRPRSRGRQHAVLPALRRERQPGGAEPLQPHTRQLHRRVGARRPPVGQHASIAFADAQKVHHLSVAVDRRDPIGQAKGILMERHRIKDDEAFRMLVKASQDHNRKLYELRRS